MTAKAALQTATMTDVMACVLRAVNQLYGADGVSTLTVNRQADGSFRVGGLTPRENQFFRMLMEVLPLMPAPVIGEQVMRSLRAEASAEAQLVAEHVIDQAMTVVEQQGAEAGRRAAGALIAQMRTTTVKDIVRDQHGDIVRIDERKELT